MTFTVAPKTSLMKEKVYYKFIAINKACSMIESLQLPRAMFQTDFIVFNAQIKRIFIAECNWKRMRLDTLRIQSVLYK